VLLPTGPGAEHAASSRGGGCACNQPAAPALRLRSRECGVQPRTRVARSRHGGTPRRRRIASALFSPRTPSHTLRRRRQPGARYLPLHTVRRARQLGPAGGGDARPRHALTLPSPHVVKAAQCALCEPARGATGCAAERAGCWGRGMTGPGTERGGAAQTGCWRQADVDEEQRHKAKRGVSGRRGLAPKARLRRGRAPARRAGQERAAAAARSRRPRRAAPSRTARCRRSQHARGCAVAAADAASDADAAAWMARAVTCVEATALGGRQLLAGRSRHPQPRANS
jgi:hypothetical protein